MRYAAAASEGPVAQLETLPVAPKSRNQPSVLMWAASRATDSDSEGARKPWLCGEIIAGTIGCAHDINHSELEVTFVLSWMSRKLYPRLQGGVSKPAFGPGTNALRAVQHNKLHLVIRD